MVTKKIERATIIILDVGKNVATPEQNGNEKEEENAKSFFDSAVECTRKIIERKILSQEKNYMGIILVGTKKTKNVMAQQCPGSFKHIELFSELQTPTWQLIRDLPKQASNSEGDWFDSLIVAADHLKNGVEGVKFLNKKIMLMTNFQAPSDFNSKTVKMVLDGFKEEEFEVDIFGPDIYKSGNKDKDLELARLLVHSTGGVSVTFDYCMKFLIYHQKKAISSHPWTWNVDLSLTPDVKIPVSCYIKIKVEPVVKKWTMSFKSPITNTASTTEGVVKNKVHVNVENQNIVNSSELIKGYHYGQQIIPLSEYDKGMLYKSGEKSLKVYGFTDARNITWHHMNGDSLMYVLGRKGDKKARYAIRCLATCLLELNLVGVVRRVFNKDNAPKLFALMPVIDSDNDVCLSMAGICFKDDIKSMMFPPTNLKKYQHTDDQVEAFKDLIRAMDLMKAYDELDNDDTEAFPIAESVSPSIQYVLDCIAFRAMNPEKPLIEPRDDIMKLFQVPPLLEEKSRNQVEKLKKILVLKKIEVKKKKIPTPVSMNDEQVQPSHSHTSIDVEMEDLPKVDIDSLRKSKQINNISTVNPINDYETLKSNGKSLSDLSPLMTEAIESLIYINIDGTYSKAFECMEFFRKECVAAEPSHYNNWLRDLKMELLERKKNNVNELIESRKLNHILKSENALSDFETTEQADSQLYENDTVPTLTDVTISSQVKAFFDDM